MTKLGYFGMFVFLAYALTELMPEDRIVWNTEGPGLIEIARVLVKNNIRGCGELRFVQEQSSRYRVQCTRDGDNWTEYQVLIEEEQVLLVK